MERSNNSWEAFNAYKKGPTTDQDYMQIVESSTSTPEDRERAKEALAVYAASFKWIKNRGDEDGVAAMFARHRAGCVWKSMTVQPLPESDAAKAAE
jgi:hypothetical protein